MSDYRSPQVLLQEAELMASSPEIVAEWLKTQDARFFNFGRDDDLEHRLLGRESPLIDLALARFGICNDVLGNLFLRNDEVIRIATLSNENIIKASILFDWRFATNSDSFEWIASLKQSELFALFANSKLPDHVISDFFDGKSAWPHLSEDHRLVAVDAMTENLIARSDRRHSWDGWADYSYSRVFDSAWSFSERADVNFK